MQLLPERHRRSTSSALSSEIRKTSNWRFPPKPSNSCPPCKHQNSCILKQPRSFNLHNIFVVDHLNFNSADPQALNSICQQHQHLEDVSFPILSDNSVTVLPGHNNFDIITPELVSKGNNNSTRAIQTKFGWTIAGPNQTSSSRFIFRATIINAPTSSDNQLYVLLASVWKTEIYVTSPDITILKKNDTLCQHYRKQQPSRMADTKSVFSGTLMLRYRITSELQSNSSRK